MIDEDEEERRRRKLIRDAASSSVLTPAEQAFLVTQANVLESGTEPCPADLKLTRLLVGKVAAP